MKFLSLMVVLLNSSFASADSGAAAAKLQQELKKCSEKDGQEIAKTIDCTNRVYAKADKLLNGVYKNAVNQLKKNDDPAMQELLKKAQLAWISLRDADCTIESLVDGDEGGSQAIELVNKDCLVRTTLERLPKIEKALTTGEQE